MEIVSARRLAVPLGLVVAIYGGIHLALRQADALGQLEEDRMRAQTLARSQEGAEFDRLAEAVHEALGWGAVTRARARLAELQAWEKGRTRRSLWNQVHQDLEYRLAEVEPLDTAEARDRLRAELDELAADPDADPHRVLRRRLDLVKAEVNLGAATAADAELERILAASFEIPLEIEHRHDRGNHPAEDVAWLWYARGEFDRFLGIMDRLEALGAESIPPGRLRRDYRCDLLTDLGDALLARGRVAEARARYLKVHELWGFPTPSQVAAGAKPPPLDSDGPHGHFDLLLAFCRLVELDAGQIPVDLDPSGRSWSLRHFPEATAVGL